MPDICGAGSVIRGVRYVSSTRLVCGRFSALIPLPFFTVVALGLAVGFVSGTFSWVYWSRARKTNADAGAS